MRYITLRDSETGKRFAAFNVKAKAAFKAAKDFIKSIGAEQWRPDYFGVGSGISAVSFPLSADVDRKVWKEVRIGEWMPRRNTLAGKEMQKRIDALPVVRNHELNNCVAKIDTWGHIGFATNNPEYYGFIIDEKWKVKVPADCEEVTVTRYNELFPEKAKKSKRKKEVTA